ncbi:unnamed protein product, partial [marine sediment metagenome]
MRYTPSRACHCDGYDSTCAGEIHADRPHAAGRSAISAAESRYTPSTMDFDHHITAIDTGFFR